MKLIVFGATGGTGRQLARQGLELGHDVTAFARSAHALHQVHEHLRIVDGDILKPDTVDAAVAGQEAVLSALGVTERTPNTILSDGTRHILEAMRRHGVRRFICLSSLGVAESRKQTAPMGLFFDRFLHPVVLRHVFADKELQEKYVRDSGLDWTLVRPARLTDGPLTGAYRHGFPVTDLTIKGRISRADVADFMLKQLDDATYLHQTPGVSY